MRSNLPVTQRGYPLRAGKTLVSVTDLKGRIVYCNQAFIDVSGYTRDELLGQAHNIIRHPDMPEEAFRDMWATIEGGRPWSALVKNRRKNGDHYWVHANATPIRDGDRPAGYLSVRSAPQPEQVAQAEALYAEMRREAESGKLRTRLHHGQVVRGGLVGRLAQGLSAAATHIGLSGLMGLFASVGTGVAAMFTGPAVWVPVAMGLFAAAHLMGRRADRQGLQRVLDDMLRLAAGDLTHDVKVTQAGTLGELQLATAQLAANLRTVIGDIRTEVENVRGAVAEISAGNLDLSSRTEAQAASLEQTAASMEEINGTVRQSAASATQGATLAAQTMSVAERSHDSVLGVVQAMEDINKSAAQVGAIIHVIESVAFQTNILALNAAVEAARAGEAGRGFAVVASEVRTLAHRTSESARQIKQLIGESTEHAAAGARLTQEARERMGEALQSVSRVNEVLGEISIAATEQQTGVAQVNEAVTHMDGVTQQNAAMVEEMSAATNALNGQIQQIVDVMKLIRLRPGEATAADVDAAGLRREAKAARDGSDAGEFDLEAAVDRHLQWKTKLRSAVMRGESLDADAASRDDGCPLGQWLHGKGRQECGHLPGFAPLLDQHAVFHREAGRVARLVNAGRKDEVNNALAGGTPFTESTQATVVAIRQLKHECAGGHTPHTTSRTTRAPVATAKSVTTTSRASTADTAEGDWATF